MTIEEIEIRKILTQMLADAGINRTTIQDMVREVIDEKVEKAVYNVSNQTNIEERIKRRWDSYVDREIDQTARRVIREKVNGCFDHISVTVNLDGRQKITSGP